MGLKEPMTESKFVPKPGQFDFTNVRYSPVVNTVVTSQGKILLVQRSVGMRLYPGYWNGISGFLDDSRSIEEKVTEELKEELGLKKEEILSLKRGEALIQEAPEYGKTWLVVPMLASISVETFVLNWEAQKAKWFKPSELKRLNLLPGFDMVAGQFFTEVL